ncbi:MAG: hypothetical protein ABW063_04175, partial [Caulobacter sp.]
MPGLARAAIGPLEAALADFSPDLLLVDHQMWSGAFLAAKHDAPWLSMVTTPASIQSAPPSWTQWRDELMAALQNELTPQVAPGPRPDLSPQGAIVFSAQAFAGSPDAALPSALHFVGPAGARGRAEIDFPWEWLDQERPLLLATLGTISRDLDTGFFE